MRAAGEIMEIARNRVYSQRRKIRSRMCVECPRFGSARFERVIFIQSLSFSLTLISKMNAKIKSHVKEDKIRAIDKAVRGKIAI